MRFISAIILFLIHNLSYGQNKNIGIGVHENLVNDSRIKSVQLYRQEWNLSYPIIKLNSGDRLELHFDLLDDQPESYYYTFIHCNKDWQESGAFVADYLEGFEENTIEEYDPSFNTTVHYYHYSLSFPNDRATLKMSGNYIVAVYLPGNRENPVLKHRFMITEDAVRISASAHRPRMTADNNTSQQVDFEVNYNGLPIYDPYRDTYAFILQNGRWDNARMNLKPEFFGNNMMKFSALSDKNIFPGGNEYRYFDIRSIRYLSEYVRDIVYSAPNYNVYLQPADNREFKPYFYWKDFNGRYYIASQEGKNPHTDADYVYVYFTLPSYQEAEDGSIYVMGALSGWKPGKENLMVYKNSLKQYECTMLLKQGWYNYEFAFVKNGQNSYIPDLYEGNHYETENDYVILLYYRNPRERYDRLIGTTIQNTLNRISD